MNIDKYNRINERLKLCYNCLNGLNGKLTKNERLEIEQEVIEYKQELNALLLS
jgi:hypothetical protein